MNILTWKDYIRTHDAFDLARYKLSPEEPRHLHTHEFAEVFWVEAGQGYQYLHDRRVELSPGDLFLVRPSHTHAFASRRDSKFVIVNLAFQVESLHFIKKRYFAGDDSFWSGNLPCPARHRMSPVQMTRLTEEAERLTNSPGDIRSLEQGLLNIISEIERTSDPVAQPHVPGWLKDACDRIHEPENFEGGIRSFVRLAGRCPEYVSRQARAHLNTTPTDIVNRARLDFASRELASTERKVTQIALDCGFNGLTHFYKLFRDRFGITPRQYRLRRQRARGVKQHGDWS